MIGGRIESRSSAPVGAILLLIAALGLFADAPAAHSLHPAFGAVLPLMIAVALLLTRSGGSFAANLTEEGLELADPPQLIPYAAIEGLTINGKPTSDRAPLYIFHPAGVVSVPARLDVLTSQLYAFLVSRMSESGSREVPAPLAGYLQRQAETFGEPKVYSYRARQQPTPHRRRRAVAVCLAVCITGVVWLVAGIAGGKPFIPWAGFGGMLAFLFGLFALAFALEGRRSRIKNWRQSGLVIGPAGLALVQGDMSGELRWAELRDVKFRHQERSFRLAEGSFQMGAAGPTRGIHLFVEGARIVIADIYDRPLPLIYSRIRAYWRDRETNA